MVWSEDFSSLTGGSEMTSWKGWTGSKMFNGTNCLKVGSGKASGEAISPIVEMPGASGRAEFSLRGFGSDGTTVTFSGSVDGGEWSEWGAFSNLASTAEMYSVPVPSCQLVQLKWTGRGKRFHLDDVAVYKTEMPVEPSAPALDLDPGDMAVELIRELATRPCPATRNPTATTPTSVTFGKSSPFAIICVPTRMSLSPRRNRPSSSS